MLRRWNSPTPFAGVLVEHECPRCHRAVELPFGALCGSCVRQIDSRAAKWGNLTALVTTLLLAGYVVWSVPRDPMGRLVGTMAVVIWFGLSNIVVRRAVRELMK
jgi:hypothetical protein